MKTNAGISEWSKEPALKLESGSTQVVEGTSLRTLKRGCQSGRLDQPQNSAKGEQAGDVGLNIAGSNPASRTQNYMMVIVC